MNITVAICTWNRAELLAQTLEAAAAMVVPEDLTWELLVVDNNSSDRTPEILTGFADRLPLRSILERELGLSHARNAAVENAAGEIIVWTDDDVLVRPDWISAYHDAFRAYPESVLFGGPVEPWYEGTPPDWMETGIRLLPGVFAVVNHGEVEKALSEEILPWGANFAIRTEVQREFPYDPELGRLGDSLRSGEESAVMMSILQAGYQGRWVPEAGVRHFIPKVRQREGFVRRRLFAHGRHGAEGGVSEGPLFLGRPRWVWKAAILEELRYRFKRRSSPPEVWMKHLGRAAEAQGRLVGGYSPQGNETGGVR